MYSTSAPANSVPVLGLSGHPPLLLMRPEVTPNPWVLSLIPSYQIIRGEQIQGSSHRGLRKCHEVPPATSTRSGPDVIVQSRTARVSDSLVTLVIPSSVFMLFSALCSSASSFDP